MRSLIAIAACLALAPIAAHAQDPAPQAGTEIYRTDLMTRWGREVTPENAWRSYPRPQLERERWQNLNGLWDYAIAPKAAPQPERMDGRILVPFAVESKLSGVTRKVTPDDRVWYRRSFTVPADWQGEHVMLNFGAVDYEATVRVNGSVVGSHEGGFDAFGFDITPYLREGNNELVVEVTDPTSAGTQPRGKQILDPAGIWYTAVSGIWQTVWIEPVPELHIADVRATPDIDRGVIEVAVALSGWAGDTDAVRLTASAKGKTIASTIIRANRRATLAIPDAHLWSPDDPHLYDLKAELVTVRDPYAGEEERDRKAYDSRFTAHESQVYADAQVAGAPRDSVDAYFAMRKISVGPGKVEGQPAILLNNEPLFQSGVLDQGWWPDGLYTPPSEEAMASDIVFLKKAGFNMLRKHIKVEPARYYYDADRLGMLIWQDMPSGGGEDQYLAGTSKYQAVFPSETMAEQQKQLSEMVGELRAFPSIVMWVVNNEGWGQYDAGTLAQFVKGLDPSRLVNATSGWVDAAPEVSDVLDIHTYEDVPNTPRHQTRRAIVLGEYGGVGFPVEGHIWRPGEANWSYQVARDEDEYLVRFRRKMEGVIRQAQEAGLSAAVYTQTSDVEDEINGLLTYDRAGPKAPPEELAEIADPLWSSSTDD
ncbi:glycoside hydrolase family 2 protein [Pelagerythrobacter sp.]|uniref:glycoside hydrolase family 2 protein n=1 Tax=Pelagerythrobacter sp. TaxID=2800702 RepID=UPI0035AE59F4